MSFRDRQALRRARTHPRNSPCVHTTPGLGGGHRSHCTETGVMLCGSHRPSRCGVWVGKRGGRSRGISQQLFSSWAAWSPGTVGELCCWVLFPVEPPASVESLPEATSGHDPQTPKSVIILAKACTCSLPQTQTLGKPQCLLASVLPSCVHVDLSLYSYQLCLLKTHPHYGKPQRHCRAKSNSCFSIMDRACA